MASALRLLLLGHSLRGCPADEIHRFCRAPLSARRSRLRSQQRRPPKEEGMNHHHWHHRQFFGVPRCPSASRVVLCDSSHCFSRNGLHHYCLVSMPYGGGGLLRLRGLFPPGGRAGFLSPSVVRCGGPHLRLSRAIASAYSRRLLCHSLREACARVLRHACVASDCVQD